MYERETVKVQYLLHQGLDNNDYIITVVVTMEPQLVQRSDHWNKSFAM